MFKDLLCGLLLLIVGIAIGRELDNYLEEKPITHPMINIDRPILIAPMKPGAPKIPFGD